MQMQRRKMMIGLTGAALGCAAPASAQIPTYVAAAIADPRRGSDIARDPTQRAAELFTFVGARPGDRIADFWPLPPYSTHILSGIAGPAGHVYAIVPEKTVRDGLITEAGAVAMLADFTNVTVSVQAFDHFAAPEPLDLVYFGKIYHDLPNVREMGPLDIGAINSSVFRALKPGGHFVVVDHSAGRGSGYLDSEPDMSKRVHRIDPDIVRAQVLAAGFEFEAQSNLLANPNDPHTLSVFNPAIREHTDRFAFKFRKPR